MNNEFWWKALAAFLIVGVITVMGVVLYYNVVWHKQPWQDASGKWHTTYVCRAYTVTDYTSVSIEEDGIQHTIQTPVGHHINQDCRYE